MARQRFIWPDLWSDPVVGRLTPEAMLLFIGCFSNADDDGRLLADPAYLKGTIFPYQPMTTDRVRELRDEIAAKSNNVQIYVVDNVEYLVFHKWGNHQKPKYPKPSKLPPPPRPTRRKPAPAKEKPSGNDSGSSSLNGSVNGSGSDSVTGLGRDGMGSSKGSNLSKDHPRDSPFTPPELNGSTPEERKINTWIGDHADQGTARVIHKLLRGEPDQMAARTHEACSGRRPRDRAGYAVQTVKLEKLAHRKPAEFVQAKAKDPAAKLALVEEALRAYGHPDDVVTEHVDHYCDLRREAGLPL